ncbi:MULTISPECIES: BolA family protein [unclassified Iodidimonas]|jgi:BolA protein|uniref:BolA family protein n=1 Tax=unclassified Iodidimonas TaxID=2626145 RepID=UPI0024829AC8|nr:MULTISPECIES: BolA family protein [unclassified Iodidimonas]
MTHQNTQDSSQDSIESLESLGPAGQALQQKLAAAFSPDHLRLRDESHKHEGHAGHRPEGESHFHLEMTSRVFSGQSRVARQRMVYALLADELKQQVHALSLSLAAPDDKSK